MNSCKSYNKFRFVVLSFLSLYFVCISLYGQDTNHEYDDRFHKSDQEQDAKANEWVSNLSLNDSRSAEITKNIISDHLKTVRDWHNAHSFTEVPPGINPKTGERLNELDRRMIAHSAKPDSIHTNFLSALREHLTEQQVIEIMDSITVGKVDFTMKGYYAIVPDLTSEEATHIRNLLEMAREQAIDYKNMEEISAIFEIYKTKAENYLNLNGRNWRKLYKDYVNSNK